MNILQLWQKAFQYNATSTQKNSQKTNKQKTPSGTNKQTSTTTKKNHKEVYLVTSGHLCEKEKVEKYFLVCTHISFLYLYQCLWLHDEVLDITVGADRDVTGAENTEFAVYISVAVALDFCGPWSEYPLVTEE